MLTAGAEGERLGSAHPPEHRCCCSLLPASRSLAAAGRLPCSAGGRKCSSLQPRQSWPQRDAPSPPVPVPQHLLGSVPPARSRVGECLPNICSLAQLWVLPSRKICPSSWRLREEKDPPGNQLLHLQGFSGKPRCHLFPSLFYF